MIGGALGRGEQGEPDLGVIATKMAAATWWGRGRSGSGGPGGEAVEEADEVVEVQDGRDRRAVAIGVAGDPQLPGVAVVSAVVVAPEEDGHTAGRVVGHRVGVARRGTADRTLSPGGPVPFPGLAVEVLPVVAPEEDGHAAGRVVGHGVEVSR